MPKSRRKRNDKKDFQKVKLKVGRSLKKADNTTATHFKSHSIVLKEQLITDVSQPTTKRHQNISDLLSKIQHYNTTVRQDAVIGLQELLSDKPDLLFDNLSVLIERVSSLFVDKDAAVRKATLKLYTALFPLISVNKMLPFFSILNAYLCCAMTHIYDDVQMDSLSIIDLCLETYPTLVMQHCSQLLTNFINMISKGDKSTKRGTIGGDRVLTISQGNKLCGQKWRRKVLERLNAFLSALCMDMKRNKGITDVSDLRIVEGDFFHKNEIPALHRCSLARNFTLRSSNIRKQNENIFSDPKQMEDLINILLPLMLQIWVESSPSQLVANTSGDSSAAETAKTMMSIIEVIHLLWQCVYLFTFDGFQYDENLVFQQYEKDFIQHFMQNFPYSIQEAPETLHKDKGKPIPQNQILMLKLNLYICKIMSHAMCQTPGRKIWIKNVSDYVTKVSRKKLIGDDLNVMLSIVQRLINVQEFAENGIIAVWNIFSKSHPLSTERAQLLAFLRKYVLPHNELISFPLTQKWLLELPHGLLDTLMLGNDGLILEMYLACIQSALTQKIPNISEKLLAILPKVFCQEALFHHLPEKHQRRIVELIGLINYIDTLTIHCLLNFCKKPATSTSIVSYLVQLLNFRCLNDGDYFCSVADYLSFVMSLVISIHPSDDPDASMSNGNFAKFRIRGADLWNRKQLILGEVLNSLQQWQKCLDMREIIPAFIAKTNIRECSLSFSSAFSIIKLVTALFRENDGNKTVKTLRAVPIETMNYLLISLATSLVTEEFDAKNPPLEASLIQDIWNVIEAALSASFDLRQEFISTVTSVNVDDDVMHVWLSIMIHVVRVAENPSYYKDRISDWLQCMHTMTKQTVSPDVEKLRSHLEYEISIVS
ncbi:testis-expressed protein 10-like [Tubulanus polymorphus]|uniref:testis-expressed protein 10-like n=1 Tax=Tubulanus polymorphus TaxID=672921 RepID=UPI003DA5FED9